MFKLITAALLATATAKMTSWDKKCGSKFDRIITDKLSFKSSKKTLGAGDTVTIDTSGTNMLHTTFMGGSWSVRVYEEGWAHPVGDFTGDLSKVMTFPDAKNTTFDINGVTFDLPAIKKPNGTNVFQVSFTAQDFHHATYFCVDVFYNLDTGKISTSKAAATTEMSTEMSTEGNPSMMLHATDNDGRHCHQLYSKDTSSECFTQYWAAHDYQFVNFKKGLCPAHFNDVEGVETICGGKYGTYATVKGIR